MVKENINKIVLHNIESLEKYLEKFNSLVFAIDTETEGFSKLKGISLCDGNSSVYIPNPTYEMLNLLKFKLQGDKYGKGKTIIGHNLVFDLNILNKVGLNFYNAEWFDTMVASHLINENGDKSLKSLIRNYFPEEEVVEFKDIIKFGMDSKEFYLYAINDAWFTYKLSLVFKDLLIKWNVDSLFRKLEMPFLRVLLEMQVNGIKVDYDSIIGTTSELKKALFDYQIKMLDLIGEKYSLQANLITGEFEVISDFNLNSSRQLISKIENLGLIINNKTKTGNKSIGKATIKQLKNEHEFINLLEKYKIINKLLNSFFIPLKDLIHEDGRVHPIFNSVGTVTGRISCSEPNIQQLPKINEDFPIDTRKCFVASKGFKLIAADYSQQELRIMAHLSKDEKLMHVINNEGDIHLINANNVFNLNIPEEKLYTNHPEFDKIKKEFKKHRDMGKIFSFGIAYGMGIHKLSRDFKISLDEAQVLLNNFFNGFPQLKVTIDKIHKLASKDLFVVTPFGRYRRFTLNQWGKLDDKSLRQSFNFLIQSMGADIMRKACVKILNYSKANPEKQVTLLMSVHDEIVIECNENYVLEVKEEMIKMMEGVVKLRLPLKVEACIGNNYGEVK